jgi:hypothetical protein
VLIVSLYTTRLWGQVQWDTDSYGQSEIYMTTINSLFEYLPDHLLALKHCSLLFYNTRLGNGNITRLFRLLPILFFGHATHAANNA